MKLLLGLALAVVALTLTSLAAGAVGAWERKADMPGGSTYQSGHRLAFVNGGIYAFRGYDSNELYGYDNAGDSWTTLTPSTYAVTYGIGTAPNSASVGSQNYLYVIGRISTNGGSWLQRYDATADNWDNAVDVDNQTGSHVKNGASMTWDGGDYLYITFGGSYSEERCIFYRYTISSWGDVGAWTQLANTPYRQQAGAAVAWIPGSVLGASDENYVYAFVGGGHESTTPNKDYYSRRFIRYTIGGANDNTWTDLDNGAAVPSNVDDGGSLVWTGGKFLYAVPGADLTETNQLFLRFDLLDNTWEYLENMPEPVEDAGGLVYPGSDYLYALCGANDNEEKGRHFYRYQFSDEWEQTDWKGGPQSPAQVGAWDGGYDNFYENDNVDWLQDGRIRLENATTPPSGIASHVTISEFATRGPGGASDEFVELYNPTENAADIENWTFDYWSGTSWSTKATIGASDNKAIPAYGFYLLAPSEYTGSVPCDKTFSAGLADGTTGSARGIRIRDSGGTVVDKVVYEAEGGTENAEAESGLTAPNSPTSPQSVERKSGATHDDSKGNGYDTDNNYNDFYRRAARNPQNTSSAAETPPGDVVTFDGAGSFTSSIFDAGSTKANWSLVTWSENKPAGTDVAVKVRFDNSSGDILSQGWTTVTNGQALDTDAQYAQYCVEFTTVDTNVTPELEDICLEYVV